MKYLILILVFLFLANSSRGQSFSEGFKEKREPIEVGSVNPAFQMHAKLLYYADRGTYMLLLKNVTYRNTVDLYHIVLDTSEITEFYDVLLNNLGKSTVLEKKLARNEKLSLDFKGNKVEINLWDGASWNYSMAFSRRQLENLFGDYFKYQNMLD